MNNTNAFEVFRSFYNHEEALALQNYLQEDGIDSKLFENKLSFDPSFANNSFQTEYQILIAPYLFEKANNALEKQAEELIENVPKDYYLYEFNNEELYDILLKQDEWNELDICLAKKLLKERGEIVSDNFIASINKKRIDDLKQTNPFEKHWIYAGYLFLFIYGLPGVFVGIYLLTASKTLPNGMRIHTFTKKGRMHGNILIILGILGFIAFLVIKVLAVK
ncbi:MAG: hypothetical protein LRY27_03700 [Chitinophagales bacterium]|nr:hypothetical protein [Chitinophagales bacterium]